MDAGYLFAAGERAIYQDPNKNTGRSHVRLDHEKIVEYLTSISFDRTGLELLRIYWYDGTDSGITESQKALAFRPNVKLRLGTVNSYGQQKGVDSLLVADLINLSRNRAMASVVLLTGDEDIRVGVMQAQEFGVRVYLLGIGNRNQSVLLRQEVDDVVPILQDDLETFLLRQDTPDTANSASALPSHPSTSASLEECAREIAARLTDEQRSEIRNTIPREIDKELLYCGKLCKHGERLSEEERRNIRDLFKQACRSSSK